jgi:hypothetical protein
MRYAPTSLTNYVVVLAASWLFLVLAVKQPLRFEFDLANTIVGWLLATIPAIATWRFYKLSSGGCLPALVSKGLSYNRQLKPVAVALSTGNG